MLKTTDAGDTWTITRFGDGRAGITAMDFTSATDGWLATGVIDGYVPATIWKTTDGGATWTAAKTREGSTISDLAATAGGECYAAGQVEGLSDWKGIILHSTDGGAYLDRGVRRGRPEPQRRRVLGHRGDRGGRRRPAAAA